MKTDPQFAPLARPERKTVDLCAAEDNGRRCIRERGHDGVHECIVVMTGATLPSTWE